MPNSYTIRKIAPDMAEVQGKIPVGDLPALASMFGPDVGFVAKPPELDGSIAGTASRLGVDVIDSEQLTKVELAHFVPDSFPPTVADHLALLTLAAVQQKPGISYGEVLDVVAESADLMSPRKALRPAEVAVCAGIVAIAHCLGQQYFAEGE